MPHFLAMTATPIPRSLALTLYGDLELSVLDEMPQGASPLGPKLFYENVQTRLEKELGTIVKIKEKAYVVYPLIEESEKIDLNNAVAGFDALQNVFPNKIGLLHGRLSATEKEATISAFKRVTFKS